MSQSRAIPPSVDPEFDPTGKPYAFPLAPPERRPSLVAGFMSLWRRRRWIHEIERRTGSELLSYVSGGPMMLRDDAYHFQRVTAGIDPGASILLLLVSPGGQIDAADLLMRILRDVTSGVQPHGRLEIVVPGAAKSAATLMAAGADRILMSRGSELGPIDPQYVEVQPGGPIQYSAFDYLRAYEAAETRYRENPSDPAARLAFARFDRVRVETMRSDLDRTRQIAEGLMRRVGGINYTQVTSNLLSRDRFPSHEQPVGHRGANDVGLTQAEYVDPRSDLWRLFQRVYGSVRAIAGSNKKVIESRRMTIIA